VGGSHQGGQHIGANNQHGEFGSLVEQHPLGRVATQLDDQLIRRNPCQTKRPTLREPYTVTAGRLTITA
jgi:hypothetical protein